MPHDLDQQIRLAAFSWLRDQVQMHGEVLPRTLLATGFLWNGQQVPILGPQGIFKPRVIPSIPLSITTSPKGPYDDHFGADGLLRYAYRGTNPQHHENIGLRDAMRERRPLVYLHGIVPGKYLAAWPAYIVHDEIKNLMFSVALDDAQFISAALRHSSEHLVSEPDDSARRAYITGAYRQRLHQKAFRERVLHAYRMQCALCRLRHEELLDAAHIIPDTEPDGDPIVQNGLSLCKLHHSAYDRSFLTIRPDYIIEIRDDILTENDGPMLQHGLKELHNTKIIVPASLTLRPDPERLRYRYEQFLASS